MFRDVPECSGMFHVPGFIDGPFSAPIMIISYDNDILIFDMNSVIKIISRYYHSIITKILEEYQNINNQTNDILS